MKSLYVLLFLLLSPFAKTSAQQFILPPFTTDVPCYDGSSYTLNVTLNVVGIHVVNVFSDNGTSGSFSFELLFQYVNFFDGTIGNGATSFYTYDITFYSENPNLAGNQISNNLQVPLANGSGSNISLNNNNTYNGSASAMGLVADSTYSDQAIINLFGFDSVRVNLGAPCLTAVGSGTSITPLPVLLGSFIVNQKGSALSIDWYTQGERNNKGFQLQKSRDGKNWTNLSWVSSLAAQGNSSEMIAYNSIDAAPYSGDNFYRLLQTDLDGRTEVSRVIRYYYTNDAIAASPLIAYPQPASGILRIKSTDPALTPETVTLFDLSGRKMLQTTLTGSETAITVSSLPDGFYWLRWGDRHLKVVIQH